MRAVYDNDEISSSSVHYFSLLWCIVFVFYNIYVTILPKIKILILFPKQKQTKMNQFGFTIVEIIGVGTFGQVILFLLNYQQNNYNNKCLKIKKKQFQHCV